MFSTKILSNFCNFDFQRRKKSTRDVLDKIRKEICDIEEFNQSTHTWHKKLLGYLLAYFSVIYLIAAVVAYFKYFNNPLWRDFTSQLQLMTPFIVAPFIFIFLKRFLTWWYHRKIKRNEVALTKLKEQKAKILDEVMETETYKVAKEILDEFASEGEKRALNVSFWLMIAYQGSHFDFSDQKSQLECYTKQKCFRSFQNQRLRNGIEKTAHH